jgi:glyoxylase-like metal-dependent hydrolase (beta-lactamase superfamily II)
MKDELATRVSRRQLIAGASCFSAFCGLAKLSPFPTLAAELVTDSRIATSPLFDRGFASVRRIGDGVYATVSDPSRGLQTTCNGGFLVGRDAAFLIEGFNSTVGASFQMDALRMASRVPVMAALNTHHHYDHSMGNSFYGASGIALWAHAAAAKRMVEAYVPMQGVEKETALAPFLKRVRDANSDIERAHAQSDVDAMTEVFNSVNASLLGLPNHPLDPAKLPLSLDLGGLTALLDFHPGHSGTDIVVRIPGQNVIYTGDLLFNGKYPVCFDEQVTVSGWRETLKNFAALDKDTLFVPGHGQVCGQEGIAAIREVFDDIVAQAEGMYHAGVPVEEAQHRYAVPDKFKNLPIWSWGFTIGSAIANLYKEWRAVNR